MHFMMTSSNGNIFRVTGLLCGEFTGHRWFPRTKASDVELWCFLWSAPGPAVEQKWWCWRFEMPSRSLWRHCNVNILYILWHEFTNLRTNVRRIRYVNMYAISDTRVEPICLSHMILSSGWRFHHYHTCVHPSEIITMPPREKRLIFAITI